MFKISLTNADKNYNIMRKRTTTPGRVGKEGQIMDEITTTYAALKAHNFDSNRFAEAWKDWIKDRAESTQAGYNVTVKAFLQWLVDEGIKHPTRDSIVSYRQYLLSPHRSRKTGEEITFSADTAARYFRGCKMFFSFLEAQGLYTDITNNVRSPKTRLREFKRDSLEKEDCLTLLHSIDRTSEAGKRDYCMILFCVDCGFRIIELQRANIGDVETHAGEHRLYIMGKGHLEKDDYKKLEPELWEALEDYLSTRGTTSKDAPLFAAIKSNAKPGGGRLTEPSISRIIKSRLKAAGFDSRRIVAHSLRHTSVTLDREAGASLEEASKHARHSSVTITQRYDHALEKKEAKDERRILDFLFKGTTQEPPEAQAAGIMARIPENKRGKALELLEAFAI